MSSTILQPPVPVQCLNGSKHFDGSSSVGTAQDSSENSESNPAIQPTKQLLPNTINPRVMEAQYAVRGALVLRAMQHQRALENKETMPFDEIIYCNIGNPHQLKQKPITFFRQVLALVDYPELATLASDSFPPDAVQRALTFLENCPGGTGAYSESQGIHHIRQHVAEFISRRDGVTASADDIFLSDGASQVFAHDTLAPHHMFLMFLCSIVICQDSFDKLHLQGVSIAMQIMIRDSADGVMIPIPQV